MSREIQNRPNLLAGKPVKHAYDFINRKAVLEIFEDYSYRNPGSPEHPSATNFSGSASAERQSKALADCSYSNAAILAPEEKSQGIVSFRCVVRRFAGNHHIVNMAFAQTGSADAYKPRLLVQLRKVRAAAVAHPRFQAAHHLIKNHRDRSSIGNAPFYSLGNQLCEAIRIRAHVGNRRGGFARCHLKISFTRSRRHCAGLLDRS